MATKDSDLCERPWCRKRWAWLVTGRWFGPKISWRKRLCDEHAERYRRGDLQVTVEPRRE